MKLKTVLQLGAICPIVIATLVALSLLLRSQESDKVSDSLGLSKSIVENVSELQILVYNLLYHRDDTAKVHWQLKHETLGNMLRGMNPGSYLEGICADRLRNAHGGCQKSFEKLDQSLRTDQRDKKQDAPSEAIRLADQLLGKLQEMTSDAVQFGMYSNVSMAARQKEVDMVVTPLLGVLALLMALGMLYVGRRTVDRVGIIADGLGAISDGDFDHLMAVHDDTEVDHLARAFNRMSHQLKASHEALKEEIAKHRGAAEALKESNIMLSDALVKLKRAQRQVVDSERLSALAQMSSGVAHDFNNTLTPILGLSDFLLAYPDNLADTQAVTEHLKTINEAVRQARDKIRRLSEFFRPPREAATQMVDLNGLVEEAILFTQPMWKEQPEGKGISIEMKTSLDRLPPLAINLPAMQEVLTNLIINSVEAMPKGGIVTISTTSDGGSVTLKVVDSGDGMTEEVRRRCFEPFFSTKGEAATGMGLTVVSGVIRGHEGTVAAESTPGAGTTVAIRLPVRPKAPAKVAAPAEKPAALTRKFSVLVVDDEVWIREVLSRMLMAEGHTVQSARDGSEGLKVFRAGRFDLIIADKAMPKMSGEEMAVAVKQESPNTAIILLTGFGDTMKEHDEHPKGIDLILSKPIDIEDLKDAIARLMPPA